jgi:CRISPR-associated protein Csb2
MIIAIELLLNQYQANDWHHAHCEGLIDWPPAPWRILRAIVAGSHNVDLPSKHRETLKGLLHKMAQVEPEYYLPQAAYIQHRSPRPQMKPGKPPVKEPGKTLYAAGLLLDEQDSTIYVQYPLELSETEDLVLRLIFNGLTYLGRREAAAKWKLADQMPESNAIPKPEGTKIVAVPDSNLDAEQLWEVLNLSAADVFAKNKQAVFPGVKQTAYQIKVSKPESPKTDDQQSDPVYSVKLEVIADHGVPLNYAHQLCYNLHCSLVKHCSDYNLADEDQVVLTGQYKKGEPCQEHSHTFIQPIPDSQNRYIERLQLLSTEGYSSDALATISGIQYVRVGQQWVNLQLSDFSPNLGEYHQHWTTVTPMFLTRFPKTLRGKPRYFSGTQFQKDGPEHQALKYLRFLDHLGLSGKPTFQATSTGLGMYLDGELAVEAQPYETWEKFWKWQLARTNGKKVGRVGYQITLSFANAVQAPIGLGYACHYGLGTLLPNH